VEQKRYVVLKYWTKRTIEVACKWKDSPERYGKMNSLGWKKIFIIHFQGFWSTINITYTDVAARILKKCCKFSNDIVKAFSVHIIKSAASQQHKAPSDYTGQSDKLSTSEFRQ
jgi:hypothetical protein